MFDRTDHGAVAAEMRLVGDKFNYLKSKPASKIKVKDGKQVESVERVSSCVILDDPVVIANELNYYFKCFNHQE